jgi:hypothetical protein
VLLFGYKGNTRASKCGTAIVQSRFFVYACMKLLNELTDMKKEMFLMLIVLVNQISLYAKTDYALLGIERKVLFTMDNNEDLYQADFDDEKYFFLIISNSDGDYDDPVVFDYSVVVNGERKWKMANPINISNLDYDDLSKCIYEYIGPDGGVYVKDRDKSYGPYSKVLIGARRYPHGSGICARTAFEHYKKGQFEFWYDEEHFVHEDDGKIRKFSKRRSEYTSPNKKHKVFIADGNPLTAITIDGKNYDLTSALESYSKVNYCQGCSQPIGPVEPQWSRDIQDMPVNPIQYTTDCCIFDDGTCLFRIVNLGSSYFNGELGEYVNLFYDFYIKGDSVRLLSQGIHEKAEDENGYIIYDECGFEKYHTYYEYYDRKSDSILRYEVKKNKSQKMLLVLDKTGKHHIILDIENKVGFVDEKRIDLDIVLPWSVKFNESKNAFQWVCIEGKDIVFYSYSLK